MNGILPFIPERASTLADRFEALFWYVTITTALAGLLVYAALFWFCVRYRRGKTPASTPRILGSERLEISWTIIPMLVFLTFFAGGVWVFNYYAHPPEDAMEVFIIGKQWMWKAQYPDGQRVIVGGNPANMNDAERKSIGRLVVPINRPIKLTITSEDVIHDFGLPAFRAKMDALPGRYTSLWFHPTKLGEFHIFCDQYCGTWHSLMVGKVAVVSQEEFDQFLAGHVPLQSTENAVDGSMAWEGRQLFLKLQCIKCHTDVANSQAPSLAGVYGSRVPLRNGGAEIADDEYIIQSILKPRAKVVQNYEAVMPSYEGQVTAEDLNKLVAYIRSLNPRTGSRPPLDTARFPPAPVGAPTERKEPEVKSPEKK
jgi:cytochrome c oxidase subunit 2